MSSTRGSHTIGSYLTGFIISIALTLVAYGSVVGHVFSNDMLMLLIAALAFTQFVMQLVYFLHLGRETRPRWKFMVFLFMIVIVFILVVGSLWIMANLDYHTMSPSDLKAYLHNNEGL